MLCTSLLFHFTDVQQGLIDSATVPLSLSLSPPSTPLLTLPLTPPLHHYTAPNWNQATKLFSFIFLYFLNHKIEVKKKRRKKEKEKEKGRILLAKFSHWTI
jgi:hypothetical protein